MAIGFTRWRGNCQPNSELVLNNAKLAAQIAKALNQIAKKFMTKKLE